MQKGWKVLSSNRTGFVVHKLIYPINIWVNRPGGWGPLAVFDIKEHALTFIQESISLERKYLLVPCVYEESEDTTLWEWLENGNKLISHIMKPLGTRFADKVKCLQ